MVIGDIEKIGEIQ